VVGISKMLRRLLGPEIRIQLALGTDVGDVHVDRGQLEQVIVNLAINARDAMERGGSLLISTSDEILRTPLAHRHGIVPAGSYVALVMTDTGGGMDERTLARLFEPFFTTKELGKGTGLGLSTVFGIVQQSGGQIVVKSTAGGGTTFTVYLPRIVAIDPATSRPGGDPAVGTVRTEPGTPPIIVVDDEDSVRTTIVRILARIGHSVIPVESGMAALQLIGRLRAEGTEPALVITDVMMPGMNGRELADQIAVTAPALPVLFVSGYSADDVFRAGDGARTYPMLNKPFTPYELTQTVNRMMRDASGLEPVIA
jgi:two-component system cell cycle sensor histidine kinase/response regulator CckA